MLSLRVTDLYPVPVVLSAVAGQSTYTDLSLRRVPSSPQLYLTVLTQRMHDFRKHNSFEWSWKRYQNKNVKLPLFLTAFALKWRTLVYTRLRPSPLHFYTQKTNFFKTDQAYTLCFEIFHESNLSFERKRVFKMYTLAR